MLIDPFVRDIETSFAVFIRPLVKVSGLVLTSCTSLIITRKLLTNAHVKACDCTASSCCFWFFCGCMRRSVLSRLNSMWQLTKLASNNMKGLDGQLAEIRLFLDGLDNADSMVCICSRTFIRDQDLYYRGLFDLEDEDQSDQNSLDSDEHIDDLKAFIGEEEPPCVPFEPFEGEYAQDEDAMKAMGLPVAFGGQPKPERKKKSRAEKKKNKKKELPAMESEEVYEAPNVGSWQEVTLQEMSSLELGFRQYWAEHGRGLVWQSWVEKYPEYSLNPEVITGEVVREETVESSECSVDASTQDAAPIHNYAAVEGSERVTVEGEVDPGFNDDLWAEHFTEMFWYYYNQYMNWYGNDATDDLVEGIEDLNIHEVEDGSGDGKRKRKKQSEQAGTEANACGRPGGESHSGQKPVDTNGEGEEPPEERPLVKKSSHEDDEEEIADVEDPKEKMKSTFGLMGFVLDPGAQP
ncbi:hypothetical protein CAPTEDRAFT_187213, partial [Capitella teleta]